MKRRFTKMGNGWGILFTKTMIELLDVNPEKDQLEVEFENKVLKLKKETKETKERKD